MSIGYPCVYWSDGKCKKFSDDKYTGWCVKGACQYEAQSNADRIRSMSDEELAKMLTVGKGAFACFECRETGDGECSMKCDERCLDWLQQPAKGE